MIQNVYLIYKMLQKMLTHRTLALAEVASASNQKLLDFTLILVLTLRA